MNTLTYFLLAGILLLFVFFMILHERRKYERFKRYLDMRVKVQLQEGEDSADIIRQGTVQLVLHGSEDSVKAVVIKDIAFSDAAFQVFVSDQLYFAGKNTVDQVLSARFRIQPHALQQLWGKSLDIHLSGWFSDDAGQNWPFKAHLPYVVGSEAEDASLGGTSAESMTALT